jgi:tetratricopeptide (TPR) repeat protein
VALDPNLAFAHALIGVAQAFVGCVEKTECHVLEALRLSPRDTWAFVWEQFAGGAKLALGADEKAVAWYRRSIESNGNFSLSHLYLAAALAHLGRLDEARAEVQAGLALDPKFTLRRYRAGASSDNPTYLAQRERFIDGMRKAGVRGLAQSSSKLVKQRLGLFQIERVEALGEPAVDRSEQIVGLIPLALMAPEPRHAHRRAQFPELRALPPRHFERVAIAIPRCCVLAHGLQQRAAQAVRFGLCPPLLRRLDQLSGFSEPIEPCFRLRLHSVSFPERRELEW